VLGLKINEGSSFSRKFYVRTEQEKNEWLTVISETKTLLEERKSDTVKRRRTGTKHFFQSVTKRATGDQ
jgi:hypothetical protein